MSPEKMSKTIQAVKIIRDISENIKTSGIEKDDDKLLPLLRQAKAYLDHPSFDWTYYFRHKNEVFQGWDL